MANICQEGVRHFVARRGALAVTILTIILVSILIGLGYGPLQHSAGISSNEVVVGIRCTEIEGCFRLVGQAVQSAPEGAIIEVAAGLYYELPILVEKSLTIRGTGLDTVIQGITPEVLFSVRNPNPDHFVQVTLESVNLRYWVFAAEDPDADLARRGVLQIEGVHDGFSPSPEESLSLPTRVVIRRSTLSSVETAIHISGAELLLEDNWIVGRDGALEVNVDARLTATNNRIFWLGGLSKGDALALIMLSGAEAEFYGNLIFNGSGVSASNALPAILIFGEGRYIFRKNTIEDLAIGVLIGGGAASVDFRENEFRNNGGGIFLSMPPCVAHPASETRFSGAITGRDNVFVDNDIDLCPTLEEGPWPPGFVQDN